MGVLYHLKNASTSLLVKESQARYITNKSTKPEVTLPESIKKGWESENPRF